MPNKQRLGLDIIGFGPIGRRLAELLVRDDALKRSFAIFSISDSSSRVLPSKASEVIRLIDWKNSGRPLVEVQGIRKETGVSTADSDSSIVVDVTNSDYSKALDARARAFQTIDSGKHFVSANKVALANYFHELFERARRTDVEIGFGATIAGGRYAVSIIKGIDSNEVQSVSALLNTSTTLILSSLETDPAMTLDQACKKAAEAGILESDWSIDLDGVDAAAKTAILSNVIFPKAKMSIKDVKRSGIRGEKAKKMIELGRTSTQEKIRLVAELNRDGASVAPKAVEIDSPLAISGRYNVVLLRTKTLGDISTRNLGGGIELTASVIISDLKNIAEKMAITASSKHH